MRKIKAKIKDFIGAILIYLGSASVIGLFVFYFVSILCFPAIVIWAIYKIITNYTN